MEKCRTECAPEQHGSEESPPLPGIAPQRGTSAANAERDDGEGGPPVEQPGERERSHAVEQRLGERRRGAEEECCRQAGNDRGSHGTEYATRRWEIHMNTLIAMLLLMSAPQAHGAALDTARIEQLTGAKGKLDRAEGVFKVSVPRNDLSVTVGGVKLTPASGLTSWAAFMPTGAGAMVMGDLVLTEDQVNPVMSVALDNGLEVTALHNHFLGESPRVMFMHIGGSGSESKVAEAVGKVFSSIGQPGVAVPTTEIDPASTHLDTESIAAALGHRGDLAGGVYKVTIGRTTRMHGHAVGTTMGVNTWAAFSGSDDRAVVDGDFAMLETELQPVLKALRRANIQVVAIHQHMTGEVPRMMFLHYWGIGRVVELAHGLRSALDQTHPR